MATTSAQPRRRRRRSVFPRLMLVCLVGGAGAAGWFWWNGTSEADVRPATVAVSRVTIEETVLAAGVLEASTLVSVGAQVSGIVETVHVTLGDDVAAGDLVAEIDRLNQENALRSAQAQLSQLQAQRQAQVATLAQAEHALTRALGMQERGVITAVDMESAELAVALARAQLAQIDAQLEQADVTIGTAGLDLDRTRITAPIAGTVVAVVVSAGQTLNAQSAAPTVIKIADLDTMQIRAEISEADITRVAPGQTVWFTIMGDPGRRIQAVLSSVEPAPAQIAESDVISTDSAIYYNGIFTVPNPDRRLRIAMTAEVTIVLDAATDVLAVPVTAVRTGADGAATVQVFDAASGTVRQVAVETGLDNDVLVEIRSGLSEGDQIITGGPGAATPTGGGQGATNRPLGMRLPGM